MNRIGPALLVAIITVSLERNMRTGWVGGSSIIGEPRGTWHAVGVMPKYLDPRTRNPCATEHGGSVGEDVAEIENESARILLRGSPPLRLVVISLTSRYRRANTGFETLFSRTYFSSTPSPRRNVSHSR